MSHTKNVDRANPGCILFLVDHSNSMIDPFSGSDRRKIDAVANGLNRFFTDLISACEKGEEKPRNYFDVGAIGYTTDNQGKPIIETLFQGPLAGRDLVSVVELYDNPLTIEKRMKKEPQDDGAGGVIFIETEIDFPVWYQPPTPDKMFGTPMVSGFRRCQEIAQRWCEEHSGSFPPIVIHLTDGESTEDGYEQAATDLKSVATSDGNLLLFNCHLSHQTADPVFFPNNDGMLPDDYSKALFRMSSELPDRIRHTAEIKGISAAPGTRGMAFNADSARMLLLINVGTAVADAKNLR